MKAKISFLFLIFFVFSLVHVFGQLTILSGPEQGSYYRFVEDIKNALGSDGRMEIINKSSNGAAYNFEQIIDPKSPYKVAMMQSDYLYLMKAYDARDNKKKTSGIKVICPLAYEQIHLVVNRSSGLQKFSDIDTSHIIAIGNKNQGTYATASYLKNRSKIYWSSRNYHFDESIKELAMDRIDAFIIVGIAPLERLNIDPAVMDDRLSLLEMDDVNGWTKYYDSLTITKDDYKWLEKDIPTFGMKSLLIVNESKLTDADRNDIKKLINGIQAKFDLLKKEGHPKWKKINLFDWDVSKWPVYK